MGADVMLERIAETSPRLKARITGAVYLLVLLMGIFAQGFVSDSLVVGLTGCIIKTLSRLFFIARILSAT